MVNPVIPAKAGIQPLPVIPAKAGIQPLPVIPAKAGIQSLPVIPAKAGIQDKGQTIPSFRRRPESRIRDSQDLDSGLRRNDESRAAGMTSQDLLE